MRRIVVMIASLLTWTFVIAQPETVPGPILPPGKLPVEEAKSVGDKAKTERDALRKETEGAKKDTEEDETPTLGRRSASARIGNVLSKLQKEKLNTPAAPAVKSAIENPAKIDSSSIDGGKSPDTKKVDPLGEALNLYKSRKYDAALRAFKLIEINNVAKEDRAFVQYVMACCMRMTNQLPEALALFRDISDAREDDFIVECAIWQTSSIRWRQDVEKQLKELKQRREAIKP